MFNQLRSKYLDICWNIGFFPFSESAIMSDAPWAVSWLRHPYKDRWFADPFLLNTSDNTLEVLVEEYPNDTHKGKISHLIIDARTFELLKLTPVLDLPTHLSFPAIFRVDNEVYIYPENSAAGHLLYYHYNQRTGQCTPCGELSEEPLTDAVLTELRGVHYLLSTCLPCPNGDQLEIYSANRKTDRYEKKQTVSFLDQTARSAGNLFQIGSSIIRPAQDCNGSYGKGLVFQEVVCEDMKLSFRELRRVYPQTWHYHLGMHTFNTDGHLCVIDARGYRYPFIGRMVDHIRNVRNLFR